MTESVFKDTLLRMARFSDYEKMDELLGLLKRVYITFNKTNIFTRKSWQFYEDVELRISPEYKKLLEKHEKILSEWCYEIYEETEDYDIRNVNILVGTQMIADVEETDVLFEHQHSFL